MTKLNILVVPPHDLLAHPTPSRLYHISKILSRKHNVILLSYHNHPLASDHDVRFIDCKSVSFSSVKTKNLGLYYLLNAPRMHAGLSQLIESTKIDVVIHANIVPSYITVKIAKAHGIPTVSDYHDHLPESVAAYYENPWLHRIAHDFVLQVVKRNIRMSDQVVTNSLAFRQRIRNEIAPGCEISVIPNGFDVDLFKPSQREKARKELDLEGHRHVILYCGSIDVWVDFDLLIRVLQSIQRDCPGTLLLIVGISHSNTMRLTLQDLIDKYGMQSHVKLIPAQPHEKVPLFINAADVIIAPYKNVLKNYGLPLKILESLACARPVITANISEYKQWLSEMPIVYYNNEEELRRETIHVLNSNEPRQTELLAASKAIRNRYSWDRSAAEYDKLLESLC